jgi:hypothetical protein
MRRMALIGSFVLFHQAQAQGYIPLLRTNAKWQDEERSYDPGPNWHRYECFLYYLEGDTVIDEIQYHELKKRGIRSLIQDVPPYINNIEWFSGETHAYVREDTITRYVYYRPPDWPFEQVLYDLSGIGTYAGVYPIGFQGASVTAVDTVILSDGQHRRIHFGPNRQIIEGIGSLNGFLELWPLNYMSIPPQMVCHTIDDVPDHLIISDHCACGSNVGITEDTGNGIQIGPSPTIDELRISGADRHATYSLRSIDGRLVLTGKSDGNGTANIDVGHLNAAMYVLEIQSGSRTRSAKIIKE